MENFDRLNLIAENVIGGKASADSFYSEIFKVIAELNETQHEVLVSKLEKLIVDERNNARFLVLKGMTRIFAGNYSESCIHLANALEIFKKLQDQGGIMASSCLLTTAHRSIGKLDSAHAYLQEMLNAQDHCENEKVFGYFNCVSMYQAAELNVQFKNYNAAIEYFKKGTNYIGDNPEFMGRILSGLGNVMLFTDDWKEAIHHFEKGLEEVSKSKNNLLLSKIYADISNYYARADDLEKALEFGTIGLNIRLKHNYINPSITSHIHLAEINFKLGRFDEAIVHGEKAVHLSESLKVNIKLYEAHHILSKICEASGNTDAALRHFKKFHELEHEVHNTETLKKVEQMQSQHKIEKMHQEKEIIHLRNVELKSAMDEIHDSIRYAKRIQNAILPSDNLVKKHFSESFIFYKPKDIVAGDFYWLESLSPFGGGAQRAGEGINDSVYLAACDCTGHGVPGAMVSVVCYNALNRSVREFKKTVPGEILDKTRELVIETFASFGETEVEVKDGMDISLVKFEITDNKISNLVFAGANNPIWIIRNNELIELKGDKQPVGSYTNTGNFKTQSFALQKGDCIYLFSDGMCDQFGGEAGKKYTSKKMKDFLISIQGFSMEQQRVEVEKCFIEWKGDLDQIDDVMLLGVKII